MDTTGKALVEHWTWAVSKGLMNKNTGASMRACCAKVLPVLGDDWETIDVREIDVEDALRRFVNLHGQDYTPGSLDSYQRRFRQAVASFQSYVADPAGWKPVQRESAPRKNGASKASKKSSPAAPRDTDTARGELKGTGLHEYDFPLRPDVMAKLVVPRDVTSAEMKRLMSWAKTLAVDFGSESE